MITIYETCVYFVFLSEREIKRSKILSEIAERLLKAYEGFLEESTVLGQIILQEGDEMVEFCVRVVEDDTFCISELVSMPTIIRELRAIDANQFASIAYIFKIPVREIPLKDWMSTLDILRDCEPPTLYQRQFPICEKVKELAGAEMFYNNFCVHCPCSKECLGYNPCRTKKTKEVMVEAVKNAIKNQIGINKKQR